VIEAQWHREQHLKVQERPGKALLVACTRMAMYHKEELAMYNNTLVLSAHQYTYLEFLSELLNIADHTQQPLHIRLLHYCDAKQLC
jgi:hypothetical protein